MEKTTPISITKWHIAVILALVGGFYFLRDFIGVIALAGLLAYLFNPIYKKFLKWFRNKSGWASAATTIISIIVLGIPVLIIVGITVAQAATLINNLQKDFLGNNTASFTDLVNSVVNQINSLATSVTHTDQVLKTQDVVTYIRNALPDIARVLVQFVTVTIGSIPKFIMYAITYIFVFIGFLVYQKPIVDGIKTISPFSKKVNDMYFKKMGSMTNAMVKGQFIIAFAQGTFSAIALSLVGFRPYFFFFWMLFVFLSFIPLGAGIVTIPIGIILILTGNVWQGLLVLGNHFIIVTNIDNFRPKLVPKDAYMPAALTLLAAFAGVAHFGFLGVIYGPIIMIVIVTTIQTYIDLVNQGVAKQ